ncbi:hypothetical protein Pmar_PMAR006161 [Perkinsus marinus ATCC 50983]|uniref:Uncharacterized protein n=1 Tax=Perkinsus marinus (strain ATCC 50983 / TXsc) TaxID=423536 RepID=C5LAD4_PERM5|nr:hypothetical protein Pmar_PMAR006161 [Perkinsus marinus ATCC 50983]EER06390.1 hypothetical protein Pmar_PMAR006161 [Perkinsus marinus ATCC 50983]|eukprot:XP_002774574.1 hypothetical protein Pmar_PMAR006161 [Perkinsus marinus ATCC 50983]
MSLIGISRDVAALRELTIQEFTKLNREVKELKSKVTTLQRQIHKQSALKHGGLISSPEPDDKTVLYTLSTLALDEVVEDAVASDRTEDTLEALSMETSLEGSTETTEPHCEGGKEAEGSKGLVVGSRSSSKSIDSRRDSFISTVSHVVGNVARTPKKSASASAAGAQPTSTKKRRRLEVDTSYLVETDLTVKHDGRILCDLYRFSLWPKGMLSSQLRQQLKKVPCIRELLTKGDLSIQGISKEGHSIDLDEVITANDVRDYTRLIVSL